MLDKTQKLLARNLFLSPACCSLFAMDNINIMCSLVDYHQFVIFFFVYLIFFFIDFKGLPLFICNEIHYFKLETCKGSNKIFHLIDAMQRISSGNGSGY